MSRQKKLSPFSDLPPASHPSKNRDKPATRAPRYHINHSDTGGMPISLWGMDRRDVWRTCLCFHVRTMTIFIGISYLIMYILTIFLHTTVLICEPGACGYLHGTIRRGDTLLPTQMKFTSIKQIPQVLTNDHTEQIHQISSQDAMPNGQLTLVLDRNKNSNSQVVVELLLSISNMLITVIMVYGAVQGEPSNLLPFFLVQISYFCCMALFMVGYYSYVPNVTEVIINDYSIPFCDEILRINPQLLSFFTFIFVVVFIAVKAYMITIIWNCYKYLMLRKTVIRGVITYPPHVSTNIMGLQAGLVRDLPECDTTTSNSKYAKKSPESDSVSSSGSFEGTFCLMKVTDRSTTPPPPYSTALQLHTDLCE